MTKEDDKNVDTTTGTEQKVDSTASSSVVVGKVSNNKFVFWRDWTGRRKLLLLVLVLIFVFASVAAVALVLNKRTNTGGTPSETANAGSNPNFILNKNQASEVVAKVQQETSKTNGAQATGSSQSSSSLPNPSSLDYDTSAELASNLAQSGASVDVVMPYFKRALEAGGSNNYAMNLNVGLFLLKSTSKKDAVPYFQKALTLLSTTDIDEATVGQQKDVINGYITEAQK